MGRTMESGLERLRHQLSTEESTKCQPRIHRKSDRPQYFDNHVPSLVAEVLAESGDGEVDFSVAG